MRVTRALLLSLFVGACSGPAGPVEATREAAEQVTKEATPERDEAADELAADRIRERVELYDAEACEAEAEAAVARASASPRLRAWAIVCLAAVGRLIEADALAAALLRERPDEPWAEFAELSVVLYGSQVWRPKLDERVAALPAALADHPDALRLRASYLLHRERAGEVIELADAHREMARLRSRRVSALFLLAFNDTARRPEALAAAAAVESGLEAVDAAYTAAYWLWRYDRPAEALPEIDRALAGSPRSLTLHRHKLDVLHALQKTAPDPAPLDAAIARLLELHPDSPGALRAVADMYRKLGRVEQAEPLERRLLAEFADSPAAEEHLFEQLFADRGKEPPTPALRAAQQARFAAFLARTRWHQSQRRASAAIFQLDGLRSDPTTAPERLLAAVEAVHEHARDDLHQLYVGGVLTLVERTPYLERAEALAREGLRAVDTFMEERAGASTPEVAATVRDDLLATINDSLGAALVANGRLDEAEVVLKRAQKLGPGYVPVYVHLAALARERGDRTAAEAHLLAGLAHDSWETRHPCEVALEEMYRAEHGSMRGYPRWFAARSAAQREFRRGEVLATRLAEPKPAPSFELERLDGVKVRSDELRGKIVVVKFWYTGCEPCVRELPEFQALADAYARDPEVAVVSVYHNGERAEVSQWMAKHGFKFDVLLAGSYCDDNKIDAFPTLWVLDREGRVAFSRVGGSQRLREEFGWRVESLRSRAG